MIRKTLLFRNLVDNIPKNVGLYSVGILLLIISRYAFDAVEMILGLVAFIISYSSVYVLNDIFDISEDEQDLSKRMRKPLALGSVEKPEAVVIYAVFLVTGLTLSLFQNLLFFGAVSVLIIINALYS
ncbi:MAG: UbiA family prenyltransferase, partial [Promethearchaeota archaeon]